MYKVYSDSTLIYDPRIDELALISPVVELEENQAGSFSFVIPPDHPHYDLIQKRSTIVEVYQDDDLIFSGMCIESTVDFYKQKSIYCEGELSYLNDSIQRPARYQNMTVRGLLEAYISNHNEQVEDKKRFTVGSVTVTSTDTVYRYTNMESTMQCLQDDFVDNFGGFFRIRHENNVKYIDYLADAQNTNSQIIKLGKNLIDYSSNIDSSDIATAIIPLGTILETSEIEGLTTRLDIKSVNDGKDYVFNQDAVDSYGWIYKVVEWDDVTVPSILKTKGINYLNDVQYENIVIEASAVDLHWVNSEIERFKLSDSIRVVSQAHGLDRYFRLTKQTLNLANPEADTITLGKDEQLSLSAKTSQVFTKMETQTNSILESATANATALITSAMGGYVYKTNNELYIMDTNDPETAQKVWRWNINGLGYSNTGIDGPYGLAMTMDGSIVADFITAGKLTGIEINNGNATFKVDSSGHMTASNATITGGNLILNASNAYSDSRVEVAYGNSKARIGAGWFDVTSDNGKSGINIQQGRIVGYQWTSPDMMDETFWIYSDGKSSLLSSGCIDYNDSNRKIQLGYAGAGLDTSNLAYIAGYTDGGTKIKDVSKAVLRDWLSLGNFTASGSTLRSTGDAIYAPATDNNNLYLRAYQVITRTSSNGTHIQDWNGNYTKITANSYATGSSRLIKENIESITDDEARKILDLRPVSFDYTERFGGEKGKYGLIAEETLEHIPSCVSVPSNYDEETTKQALEESTDSLVEVMSIDYAKLVPHLIKMVQIQQKQIDELKELIRR